MTKILYNSGLSVLKITDTGGNLRDVSAYIVNVTSHFGRKMSDNSTLGDTHEQSSPGLNSTSLDIEGFYSEDASVGSDTVLGPLLTDETERAWEYYPRGTGGIKYSGAGFIENYQPSTKVGVLVGFTATLRSNSRSRS
jgi:hypothetical protein